MTNTKHHYDRLAETLKNLREEHQKRSSSPYTHSLNIDSRESRTRNDRTIIHDYDTPEKERYARDRRYTRNTYRQPER